MKKRILLIAIFVIASANIYGQKLTAEEMIAKHIASIGSPEKLAALKSLIAVGEVRVEYVTQKNQPASGRMVIASEGNKMFYGMQLNAADYPQEKIIFDGNKIDVAAVRAGNRSMLGNFIQSNSGMVSQGLLGGPLTTSWALLDAAQRGAKISSGGSKKIDGKEVYSLSFSPKGTSDLDVTMYFDRQTFQHVRTEYKRTASASMGRTPEESSRMQETRIRVTEDFSDYKEHQGVNIPSKYKLRYSISGQNGTTEVAWTANFTEFAVNQKFDPATFTISQ